MENKTIKILAIDDNPDNLITLKALILERFPNAIVLPALSGLKGIELAASENPDVILLDIIMPEMDGFEVCRRLKQDDKMSDIPVIFVTALKDDKTSRIKALEVGAEAFLTKPIDQSELTAQLRAMLKIRSVNIFKQDETLRLSALVAEQTKALKQTNIATLNLLEDLKEENEARKQTEKALLQSEELYRSVIQASPDNITVTDLDGKIKMISPKGLSLIGYKTDDELLGKNINEFLIPEQRERASANLVSMFQGIYNGAEDYLLIKQDGSLVDTEINAEFVRDIDGNPTGFVFAIRDITERKLSEKLVQESEEKYRSLVENSPTGIAIYQEGKFVYANAAGLRMFGANNETDLLGRPVLSVVHPDSVKVVVERMTSVSKGSYVPPLEEKLLRFDGSAFDAEVVALGTTFNGKPAGQVIVNDITERKIAAEKLRESEEKFRNMANLLPQVVFEIKPNGEVTYVNQQTKHLFGYEAEELIGQNSLIVHVAEEQERVIESVRLKLRGISADNREFKMVRKDGTIFPALIFINVIEKNNLPVGIRGVVVDITDQKEAQDKILRSESLYRGILEASPDNIIIVGLDGCIEMISPTSIRKYGYKDDKELVGRKISELIYPDDVDRMMADFTLRTLGTKTGPNEYRALRADNSYFDIEVNGGLIKDEQGNISKLVFIARDTTDRKAVQDALIESESRYNSFIDNNIDRIFVKDENCRYLIVNAAMADFFGKDKTDIYNKTDKELASENLIYPCSSSDLRALSADEPFVIEEKLGERVFETVKFPMKLKNDKVGIGGIMRDITERKQAEERIRYVTRLYSLSSHINQAIVEIKDIDLLFNALVHLVVEYGQFRMCWIGSFDEVTSTILPFTFAGFEDGYLEGLEIHPFDGTYGNGPTGRAFARRQLVFCNDIANDAMMAPWKESALKRGYKASFSSPIYRKGEVFRTLTLYANEVDFFKDEEQKLLSEISESISYAIDAIDSETERVATEAALMKSELKYRELLDNSPEGVTIYVDGKIAYVNNEAARLMRVSNKEELIGKTIADFIHPENVALVMERMQYVAMAPLNVSLPTVEERYLRPDGSDFFAEIKAMVIMYDGKPAVQLAGRDITDRKEAEIALEQSRIELKAIYDFAPVMMCLVDSERNVIFANNAFMNLTGMSLELLKEGKVGGVVGCLNSFDDPRGCGFGINCWNCSLRTAMHDTFETGVGHTNVEYHTVVKDGDTVKEISLLGSTAVIDTISSKNLLLCLHDITDRKMAEEALQKSEMLLRTFIDNSPFEIWARDNDGIGILENKKLTDHYGSIVGHTPASDMRIDAETRQMWENTNKRAFAGELVDEEYEFEVNDETRIFQQIVFPINIKNKIIGIAGFNIDITERKIAEEKIHENSVKLDMAMQVANMAWWEMNLKTGDVIFGKRKTDMIGFAAERFTHFNHFMELIHADDHEGAMKAMRDHIYGTSEKYEIEYRIMTVEGDYKWFYDIGSVSKRDVNGKPLIVSGLVLDITERKQAEFMLLESQTELKKFAAHLQNIREEERVLLAREIHDQLGQILVAVKIDMGMLKMNVLRKFGKEVSDELIKNFDGLSALIDTTIKTARRIMTDLRPEVLDMLGFVDTVTQHLKSYQERYKVACSFVNNTDGLELTSEQSVALFRIVQEALNNIAKHAKASEVVVTVNYSNDKMFLLIADNGIGFDTTDKKNLDSYGLIGMKERVFLIDGDLTIISEKGKGTTIQVTIPIA